MEAIRGTQLTHFSDTLQLKQTMSSTKLVAFILGAGTHVGSAVAAQLRGKGYRVALGSRNPKPTSDDDAYFNVKVDVQKRESIEEAFDTVVQKLGPVNVVIYNGMSIIQLDKKYPGLTPFSSCFRHSTTNSRRYPHNSSGCILRCCICWPGRVHRSSESPPELPERDPSRASKDLHCDGEPPAIQPIFSACISHPGAPEGLTN